MKYIAAGAGIEVSVLATAVQLFLLFASRSTCFSHKHFWDHPGADNKTLKGICRWTYMAHFSSLKHKHLVPHECLKPSSSTALEEKGPPVSPGVHLLAASWCPEGTWEVSDSQTLHPIHLCGYRPKEQGCADLREVGHVALDTISSTASGVAGLENLLVPLLRH